MNKQTVSFANVILIFLIEITFSQNTFTLLILRNALKKNENLWTLKLE